MSAYLGRHCERRGRLGMSAAAPFLTLFALSLPVDAAGETATDESLRGVVQVNAFIPNDARTASSLGTEREGTGVVIDDSGLVLTIGYLILEAIEVTVEDPDQQTVPASIVAYDHESGFGLIRANHALGVKPIALGDSTALTPMQPLLVVSHVGAFEAAGVYLVDRREFAGYWEYLLEEALFTSPPHAKFGGAALLDQGGRLVGIGSLFVNDAAFQDRPIPGNMFIPIDVLKPIMADLLTRGRRADPSRPWLGLSMEEHRGRLFVTRVAPDGPGEAAGIQPNDIIVGIDGAPIQGLGDFYRKLWGRGNAGITVPLDVLHGTEVKPRDVVSADRYRYLRLNRSF
jgi:S1-C subfamily serine protease